MMIISNKIKVQDKIKMHEKRNRKWNAGMGVQVVNRGVQELKEESDWADSRPRYVWATGS